MRWRFWLADSASMKPIALLDQASNRQLGLILNRPGTGSFVYPMRADLAEEIKTVERCILCDRWDWRASLALGEPVWTRQWSGYINTIDEDITGDKMTVNCVGWLNRLDRRFTRRQKNYVYAAGSAYDDGDMIFDLLTEANTNPIPQADGSMYTAQIVPGSNPNNLTLIQAGQKVPNEGPGGATIYVPAYRGRQWPIWQNYLAAINEITEWENGCDIDIVPTNRALNIYRRKMRDLKQMILGFNWGPENIAQLGRQIDSTVLTNYFLALGSANSIPKYQDDVASQLKYGLWEDQATLSDARDLVSGGTNPLTAAPQSVLWTYAAAEVALKKDPGKIVYTLTPFGYRPDNAVPEPFVDYRIGDQMYFGARWLPRINIVNQGIRVFGMNVTMDEEDNEKVGQLVIAPGG